MEQKGKGFMKFREGSVVEIDAAIDIATKLKYLENVQLEKLGEYMIAVFKILSGLINSKV